MTRRRLLVLLGVLVLLGSSCTADDGSRTAASPASAAETVSTPESATELPGRLLIRDGSGSLVTIRPDGTERVTLAVAAEGQLEVSQAAWAPDGSRVAWGQIDSSDGSPVTRIVASTPDGGERAQAEVPFMPFYLSWDPTSSRVAFLGNREPGEIGMGVMEGAAGATPAANELDRGAPFYFSWGPAGDRLLTHVGEDRLEELELDGSTQVVDGRPGVFQAPVWSPDGTTLLSVRPGGGFRQTIVAIPHDGSRARELADVEGAVFMVLSPDGRRVAYQALEPDEIDLYDREVPARATDVGVTVLDLETGASRRVSRGLAAAWYWSPDGSRLAVLEPVYRGNGPILFHWRVWDGTEEFLTPSFSAALSLLQETTPFFSQYAQSWSMWAPDGAAFAFPVDLPDSPGTIVVQPVDPIGKPYALGRGTFVAWSPR